MYEDENDLWVNSKITEIFSIQPILKNKRLKKLNIDYPVIQDPNEWIDVVDWEEFVKNEANRIPLLVANGWGLWPKAIPNENFFQEERIVALLHIYPLSGCIIGCEVYKLPASFNFHVDFPKDYEAFKLKEM
jgi:hypothetical protein